ncbi:MAG: hypothetical protein DYG98_16695 [Haliscomenobacteraceae bacterium CHB4]|nr:hypothetical protein [Haliscomenobacteraceae bacterium CHB4]
MTDLVDILRFAAIAQILLVLCLFWRDRRSWQGIDTGLMFGLCVVGYLLADWRPLRDFPAKSA